MLKNIILPIFTKDDVAAIPAVVSWLRAIKPERLWILHNPDIGTDSPEALASFDREIESLESAMKTAAERQDFVSAGQYKQQLDAKKMDRDNVRREGWKKIGKLDLEAVHDKVLAPLLNQEVCPNIQVSPLIEAYEAAQIFEVLRGLRTAWPQEMPHGEFVMVWPRSINKQAEPSKELAAIVAVAKKVNELSAIPPKPKPKPASVPKDRRAQLRASKFMGVKKRANELQIPIEGKSFDQLIDEILAAENEPAAA